MSVYKNDKVEFLKEAFESIFTQTLLPNEIVLVKDGPLSKDLNDLITLYSTKHPIFNIIENEKNIGLGRSLAIGMTKCTNEFIARMDSDDIIPSNRFEKQFSIIQNSHYDVVSCWSSIFSNTIDNIIAVKKRPEFHKDIVKLAKRRSPVSHAACFFRKSSVLKAGGYQHCEMYEDYHLWARMIMNGAIFYNIQESLYFVRITPEQISRRGGWKYLKNECKTMIYLYSINLYSIFDLFINLIIRLCIRLLPIKLRGKILKLVWKQK